VKNEAKKSDKKKAKRPSIPTGEAFKVWVAAAGRCTFCNRSLLENEDLGEAVKIGELAHNVGWGDDSPRGDDPLEKELRQQAENLVLACRNCHKPIDDGGVVGRYTVSEIAKRKHAHETRIRELTAIGADRAAVVVRFATRIRDVPPEMSRDTVLEATTAAGLYPQILPGSHWADIDLDLRVAGDPGTDSSWYEAQSVQVRQLCSRVHDGVRDNAIKRLAVFGFARIPLLVDLGAGLDDKLPTQIFNRHRVDSGSPWKWQADVQTLELEQHLLREGASDGDVALVVSLSGTVPLDEVTALASDEVNIYQLQPTGDPRPGVVQSRQDLQALDTAVRTFLANIERDHGRLDSIALFPAVGVAAAITLGRVLMPDVSPDWIVYDRDADTGAFFEALRVES